MTNRDETCGHHSSSKWGRKSNKKEKPEIEEWKEYHAAHLPCFFFIQSLPIAFYFNLGPISQRNVYPKWNRTPTILINKNLCFLGFSIYMAIYISSINLPNKIIPLTKKKSIFIILFLLGQILAH